MIDIGIDLESSKLAIKNAKQFPGVVFAAIGIDPDVVIPGKDLYQETDQVLDGFSELAEQNPEVIAIGETGMDKNWILDEEWVEQEIQDKVMADQEKLFRMHLDLAQSLSLPVTVHSRLAEWDCLEVVKQYSAVKGVFHSYTGTYEVAKQVVDLGWGLGVNGIVTFKNATELREVYRKLLGTPSGDWSPADFYAKGIYFETDAPYLAPQGKRGEKNEPAYIKDIFEMFVQWLQIGM